MVRCTTKAQPSNVSAFSDKWTRRFLDLAGSVALWSKDPSTRCGAVIVNPNRIVLGMGYNGFPPNVEDRPEWLADREIKYNLTKHAEDNAVRNASRNVEGAILFVTHPCCPECAQFVCDEGIKEVHWPEPTPEWEERWRDRLKESARIFRREGVPTYSHRLPISVDSQQIPADDKTQESHRTST